MAKLASPEGAPAKRYEDTLREFREKYDEEIERIRHHYEPQLQALDEKRKFLLSLCLAGQLLHLILRVLVYLYPSESSPEVVTFHSFFEQPRLRANSTTKVS